MPLRGSQPKERKQRLKLLMFGPAGVGKTTAAIQMPKPYIIDTESGSNHYGDIIAKAGGVVFETSNYDDIIQEVRSLATEQHEYLTLVIDPVTTVYASLLDEGERKVGDTFGKHYAYANTRFKRLCNLLTAIDMNVIITSHEKDEYENVENGKGGKEMTKVGKTFDAYKKLDYIFDLALQLDRDRKTRKRYATVTKTRLAEFPDLDRFEWTYEAVRDRYGADKLEKGIEVIAFATPDQVQRFNFLLSQLSEEEQKRLKIDKALKDVEDISDMPADRIAKGIKLMEDYQAQQLVTS